MTQRGPAGTRVRIPRLPVAVAGAVAAAASVLLAVDTGDELAVTAALLFVGDVREEGGLTALVGWLIGGALIGAALGYAATGLVAGVGLTTTVGVGLGLALGGGVGAVSSLLAADATDTDGATGTDETMTVDMEADDSPSPQPADLFDGHPDPVLYVADQGHGPVVLAANDAFARTFDVPGDAMTGTPLAEAVETTTHASASVDAAAIADDVDADEGTDVAVTCQTPDGTREFRLRTAGRGADGYVIYTPTDGLS